MVTSPRTPCLGGWERRGVDITEAKNTPTNAADAPNALPSDTIRYTLVMCSLHVRLSAFESCPSSDEMWLKGWEKKGNSAARDSLGKALKRVRTLNAETTPCQHPVKKCDRGEERLPLSMVLAAPSSSQLSGVPSSFKTCTLHLSQTSF